MEIRYETTQLCKNSIINKKEKKKIDFLEIFAIMKMSFQENQKGW